MLILTTYLFCATLWFWWCIQNLTRRTRFNLCRIMDIWFNWDELKFSFFFFFVLDNKYYQIGSKQPFISNVVAQSLPKIKISNGIVYSIWWEIFSRSNNFLDRTFSPSPFMWFTFSVPPSITQATIVWNVNRTKALSTRSIIW